MGLCLDNRRLRYLLFAALALTINLIDSSLIHSQRAVVSAAAWFDMVAVVAALYYWLLVRPGIRGKGSIVPIALAGVMHASSSKAVVAGLCELGLIAYIAIRIRRRKRTSDPVEGIAAAVHGILPVPRIAAILTSELGILYYAVCSWRAKPHVPADAVSFPIHRNSMQRDLFYVMALVSLIEMIPAHILIHLWSPVAAWIATAVSLYAGVWLVGLARSMELRPVVAAAEYMDIRYGLLFHLRIPREKIAAISRVTPQDAQAATVVPSRSEPNLRIDLTDPLEAEKLFGMRAEISSIAFSADESFNAVYPTITKLY